jgi:hypothetical protein
MGISYAFLFVAVFGAVLQELSYWYQLRGRLDEPAFSNLIKSKAYWIITSCMIIASPIGVAIWIGDEVDSYKLRDALLFGAAFPMVFRSGVSNVASIGSGPKLGAEAEVKPVATYFGLNR